ncbi:hypothetical protein PHLGIDRAFT_212597 [Phlebiopsis gigantea 11061_1 CR5-6]|uniref:VIT domain-containing protein n=1 Tax=Phlebiopsis gigantea (strain 11061_1 CR5-6) TaxID=745531 RepID=A0A0C3PEU5_PHLG1|nr:hypothetical protein PHLGIDRAFT_212597 [Phlebiopsis gigantea 11061_1 CR5-6]
MQLPNGIRRCGIAYFASNLEVYLPLEDAEVHADIVDVSTIVTITQHFWQYAPDGIKQAKYVFPIPARAAVCGFAMTAGETTITAVAKEKEEAAREHNAAISHGYMTGLVQHVTEDIFSISVGALPGRMLVTTRVTYVLDLTNDDAASQIRLQLPVHIGYRFGTLPAGMKGARKTAPYRIKISVDVRMQGNVRNITSPSHPTVVVTSDRTTRIPQAAQYTSRGFLEQDFVLLVTADGIDAPRCFAQRAPDGTVALQLNVVPKFSLPSVPQQEYIFLVDRSASMMGSRIAMAKRTLVMLLRALPSQGTWFNIFSFGHYCDELWRRSVPYDEEGLRGATSHVDMMDANYGGTNIEDAIDKTLRSRKLDMPTAIFVITDGESYETDRAIGFVKAAVARAKDHPVRVFTLGIGDTASSAMCEGLARAGNGICLMATQSESILGKCSRLVRISRSHIYNDVTVDWGVKGSIIDSLWTVGSDSKVVSQAPSTLPFFYPGDRFVVFAWIQNKKFTPPKKVVIYARPDSGGEMLQFSVPVQVVESPPQHHHRPLIHTLMARRAIMELEDSDKQHRWSGNRTAIIHLGTRYQLVSTYTSFVAVDKHTNSHLPDLQPPPYEEDYGPQEEYSSYRSPRPRVAQTWTMPPHYEPPAPVGGAAKPRRRSLQLPSIGGLFRSSSSAQAGQFSPSSRAMLHMAEIPHRAPVVPVPSSSGFLPRIFRRSTSSSTPMHSATAVATSAPTIPNIQFRSPAARPMAFIESYDPTIEDYDDPSLLHQEEYGSPSPSRFLAAPRQARSLAPPTFYSPPAGSAQAQDDKVIALVRLQAFDGGFPGTDILFFLLGGAAASSSLMKEAKKLGVPENVWATVLAIAYLKVHVKDQPDLLDGLVEKAMTFLSQTPQLDVGALLLRAQKMLPK